MNRTSKMFTNATTTAAALLTLGLTTHTTIAAAQAPFDPNAYYSLTCKTSSEALDNGGTTKPSAQNTGVFLRTWLDTGPNQAWQITSAPNNSPGGPIYSNLMSFTSEMALVSPGSNADGQDMFQYWAWWDSGPSASDMPVEDWLIQPAPGASGYYNLTSKSNGMALDGGSTSTGSPVVQWPLGKAGSTNQEWQPVPLYSWVAIP